MDIMNMSDLQISLIIIGAVIIVGVAVFNWVQQLRYRNKMQASFDQEHEDVLLETDKVIKKNERIEPQLKKTVAPVPEFPEDLIEPAGDDKKDDAIKSPVATSTDSTTDEFDSNINYIASLYSDSMISSSDLTVLLHGKFDFGKPVHWLGQEQKSGSWEEITLETNANKAGYIGLKGCLQLADRAGPVSEVNLSKFRDIVQEFASQVNAVADCPDIVAAHDRAILLDKFCAEVDVMIGINIISKDDGAFVGTKIRALAEASGFKLGPEGIFKYRDDNHAVLFTLSNYESVPFISENIRTLTTHGITFLLDVPRVANGEKVFDQLTHLARIFSSTLGGIIVDDNRVPLSDRGLIRSKQQLSDIQKLMKKQKILAGSKSALRLFV